MAGITTKSTIHYKFKKTFKARLIDTGGGRSSLNACLKGLGITMAAPFTVYDHVLRGKLIPILPEWHFKEKPLQIIYPSKKHLSIRVRSFVDWAFALLSNDPLLNLTPLELVKKIKKE